jgi:hypothetical protein
MSYHSANFYAFIIPSSIVADPERIALLKDFGAQKFIETTDKDYLPVSLYARQVHLNLATYDYLNE